jgi:alpha-L-fucosidase
MSPSSPHLSRRRLLAAVGLAGVATATGLSRMQLALATAGPQSYTAAWSSVDQHPPAPEWFQDAKFGIYYHWGVYSVPAYASEWYPRNMYNSGSGENNHHKSVYGDPSVWPYHNFINGAPDKAGNWVQFAPKLKSAGGNWDPTEWAQLFADAGAKFAGPVAEHHDGFSMWNSQVNEWNSVARGPKLDLLRLQADAIRGRGLKLWVSLHHAYNFTGYFQWAPAQSDPSLRKLYGQLGTAEYQLWYDKLREVIDGYQPDLIYQDFNLSQIPESYRLNFLSYYYNKAVSWNTDVAATYKDGFDNRGEVYDFERGGPAGIQTPYWLTDDSVSSSSWCYTQGIGYYSTKSLLHALVDRISKNGTMVLNIAPMADGTIPSGQRTILAGFGDHLRRFGEAVYATRAWSVFGEGPTQMGGGSFQTPREGTGQDIRFTRSKDNTVLYATVLGWPGATLNITTLNSNQINLSTLTSARLLGTTAGTYLDLPRTQDGSGLHLTMPSSTAPFGALAYVVKLTFSGQIPALGTGPTPTGYVKIKNVTSGLVLDSGGSVASGSVVKQWSDVSSTNLQWQLVDVGGGYYRIVNRANGMVIDSWGNTANGASALQASWNGGNNQQWRLVSVGSGRYQLVNRGTGTALDGMGSSTVGSTVCLWTPNTSTNNQWTVTAL